MDGSRGARQNSSTEAKIRVAILMSSPKLTLEFDCPGGILGQGL